MRSPLIRYRDRAVILPPQFCGSVAYYAAMACYGKVIVHAGMRYDKRFKSTHRCVIADTRGALSLTVPIKKPCTRDCVPTWANVEVSDHDQWWQPMAESLESAYGRTPYFEFYAERLLPLMRYEPSLSVGRIDQELDQAIRRILALESEVEYVSDAALDPAEMARSMGAEYDDLRRASFAAAHSVPYYQVRDLKLGFVPNLSILDLVFNMGPESQVILLQQGFRGL